MRKLLWSGLFLAWVGLGLGTVGLVPMAYADALVVGDFNNDGYPDLAILGVNTPGICVLLSNGDGTFQSPVCYPAGPGPTSILTADLNNDGNLDLLGLNPDRGPLASGVSVLLGNGDGTFQSSTRAPYPAGPYPRFFALGDLNGDGILDVAVLGALGSLCSLIGQGDGSFAPPQCFSIRYANEAHTLLLGDVTGGGRADFIYVTPSQICVWSGNTREPRCTPTRPRSHVAAIGDFTGDGILDIALVAELTPAQPTGLCVYAGNGEGGFQLTACTSYQTTVNINLITVADINGDGKLDIALAGSSRARSEAIVLLGNGDGSFQVNRSIELLISPSLEGLAIADINADGLPDLVVFGSGKICILLGNGKGGFGDPTCFSIQPTRDEVHCNANPPIFPTFDKSCRVDDNCTFGLHQVNCCGGLQAIGFNVAELNRFQKDEALCDSQYPACGCKDCRITTEDGQVFCRGTGWRVTVRCQSGQCLTAAQAP